MSGPNPTPYDAAVVIPTVLRPTLERAVRSVFAQDFDGRVQVLIGVDTRAGDPAVLDRLARECPPRMTVTVVDPGYSTARVNGGLRDVRSGGALRSALSFLAHSRHVAYLDDDNWYAPDHLSSLVAAIADHGWAWSRRRFFDAATGADLGEDLWDSVGPGAGAFAARGGLVDTNGLMIDTLRCADVLWRWSQPSGPDGEWEDRTVLRGLVTAEPGRGTGRATVHYSVDSARHALLAARMAGPPPPPARTAAATLAEATRPVLSGAAPSIEVVIHDGYRTVLASKGARAILDVGAGDGTATVMLAHAARAAGLDAVVAALDGWPADDPRPFDTFIDRVRGAGVAESVRTLGLTPRDALDHLARRGVMVDVARVAHLPDGRHEDELHEHMRAAWRVVRPSGALLVDAYTLANDATLRGIGVFAAARGLTVYTAGAERVFVLIKP